MEKQDILVALQEARKNAPQRKFTQTVDFILNLKNVNVKKEEERINTFLNLPHPKGKKVFVTALVGKELVTKAKESCDRTVVVDEFAKLDKKALKTIAQETDFFIAQASVVPQVASTFGKILGPRGKMPNPKAGGIVPPTIPSLKPVVEKLQKTVKLETKNEPTVKTSVGVESMKDEEIAENYLTVYQHVLSLLPQEKHNVKSVLVKLTMGKPVLVTEQKAREKKQEKGARKKAQSEVAA